MPSGKEKSRSQRRVFRVTPGGKNNLHYKPRNPQSARCSGCGEPLKGVPRARPSVMRAKPKTHRRPERPYGGVLCTQCSRKRIVKETRSAQTKQ